MAHVNKRNCDHCGKYYEGTGFKYCSAKCHTDIRIAEKEKREAERTLKKQGVNDESLFRPSQIYVTPKKYAAAKKEGLFHSVHYGDGD